VGSSNEKYKKLNIHEISSNLAFLLHNTVEYKCHKKLITVKN